MCLVLMTRMIVSLSYDFAEEALDFIGVHHERIFEVSGDIIYLLSLACS